MKLPLSLLKSFIHLDAPLSAIAETLTLLGIEVDAIENERLPFAKVVVGEVLSVRPHPNAQKLQIAEVFDGAHTHQVVCGAPNCRAHIKTAFAPVGALLTNEKGEPYTIETASLRGVDSHGMLCSGDELSVSGESEGILEFPSAWQAGEDLTAHLWDPVFELSLTPNLGYCLSARGIARELGASLNKPLIEHPKHKFERKAVKQPISVTVEEPKLCPRYMGRQIEGVRIGPSPFWLQQLLRNAGMRPINNGVDITNYILLKWGQPLHAFDADLLEGHSLRVYCAKETQMFACLDGIEREVAPGTLLIGDREKATAIAGVMGGANSAISDQTKNIFLEAAYFDPMTVRIASKKMGLRSESSIRFEKGTDPIGIEEALDEACSLFVELCGGHLANHTIDLKNGSFAPRQISCRPERVRKLLGAKISSGEMAEIFHRLGFTTKESGEILLVFVPPYRFDLHEEIDLVEEVARIYGYNKIEKSTPVYTTSVLPHDPMFLLERQLRTRLTGLGLQEWITCDLISPKLADLAIEAQGPKMGLLRALHSKSEEYSILRPSLLPGFLQCAQTNLDQKNHTFTGFEIGHIHFSQEGQIVELPTVALLLCGKSRPHHWDAKPTDVDFYDLKGLMENLFAGLQVSASFSPSDHLSFHPGRQASIFAGSIFIGSLGEVHPRLLEKLDIKQRIYYAELNLQSLLPLVKGEHQMKPIPQFPASERDWTIPLPLDASMQIIFNAIADAQSPLLEKKELIDLFIAEKKNATFRFTYRDPYKTISFEEVEKEHARLMQKILLASGLSS